MIKPKEPEDEKERLDDLRSYSVLDTVSEEDYDNLTAIAAEICNTKVSLVTLIDRNRQWFKSRHGLDLSETPREHAFCAHAINSPQDIFIVQDARKDERFHDNPLVTSEPNVIFYAGVPLVSERGFPLGTLCVFDNKPKILSKSQISSLRALSKQVMNLLELRKKKIHLEKALMDLGEKNLELEQFAFIAAHDLRSPLSRISMLVDSLANECKSQIQPEGQKMMDFIKQSASKLRSLIDGLLEYSRTERILGEDKTEINLANFRSDIEGLFVVDNACSLTSNCKMDSIVANRTALDQIMINLIGNAIKYNDKDVAKIEFGVSENDTEYEFYVQDNGPGIAPEHHEQIFRIFETFADKDRFGQKGNGIGLATVKKTIEKLGGSIRVESKIGAGAKFVFTIKK